jgi:hypothetical protein
LVKNLTSGRFNVFDELIVFVVVVQGGFYEVAGPLFGFKVNLAHVFADYSK